jgi:hypothetical protein
VRNEPFEQSDFLACSAPRRRAPKGKIPFVHLLGLLLVTSLTTAGRAAIIFDSGVQSLSVADPFQIGRLVRDGIASTWGSTKPFPGVTNETSPLHYHLFMVDSGTFPFLQVTLIADDPTASLFVAAYRDSYQPGGPPPNFGFDINYLGDPGRSPMFVGSPSVFQIEVAPHTQVVLPVNQVPPGGVGRDFELIVEGFAAVPEPSSFVLLGAGLAALVAGWAHAVWRAARR